MNSKVLSVTMSMVECGEQHVYHVCTDQVGWITPVQMTLSVSLFITSVMNTFHPDITWSLDDVFAAHQQQRVETA